MYQHHIDSIEKMKAYYRQDPKNIALFLIGSVATNTERPDSDLDGVIIVSDEDYAQRKENHQVEETHFGECTYEGGYFDIHYMTKSQLVDIIAGGSEPMRNRFRCSQPLFCDDPEIPTLVEQIPVYPKEKAFARRIRFYCTMNAHYDYFWKTCKAEGYMQLHIADAMIYCVYRLILTENEMLFPCLRKMEETVMRAPNKPEGIVEKCRNFMRTLEGSDWEEILAMYEAWTTYDYPKSHAGQFNYFWDPYDWE